MTTETKQRPAHKVKFRDLPTAGVAIWENTSKDGKTYFSFVLEYSYKDQADNWQSNKISLLPDEALKVKELLGKACIDFQTLPQFERETQQAQAA